MKRLLCIAVSAVIGMSMMCLAASAAEPAGQIDISKGPGAPENWSLVPNRGEDVSFYGPGMPVGPGVTAPEEEALPEAVIPPNNFLDNSVPDPVVNLSDKYSYDQMTQDIRRLQERYGDRLQVNTIGQTYDGRDIYELIVGNVSAPKHILIQGGIHAREYMTPLLMMRQLEMALCYYYSGQYNGRNLSEMFSQAAVHFIPMSNPDGISLAEFGLDGLHSDALKQGVLACYGQDTAQGRTALPLELYLQHWKSNGAGVDLNQNFPANWENTGGTAVTGSYAGFKGTAPLSEPESRALASLADRYPWAATISYHSMGNLIYWDANTSRAKESSLALAQSIADVTGYRLDGSDGRGGFKDWMQSKENPVPGVTIEVGSVECPMPLSEYEPVWDRNRAVWAQALDHVTRN